METIFCPNCGRPSGFKRALGFGTLFMVVVTFGLWLLIIPLYPARCINCGLTRSSAFFENLRTNPRRAITVSSIMAGIVLLLLLFSWFSNPVTEQHPAPIVEGANYNEVPSTKGRNGSESSAVVTTQEPTATSHQERLAALREKREAIEREMFIEHETIDQVLRQRGIQGIPEDEHEHVERLIQQKAAIDAAIKEEEKEGGSEPEPSAPTVLQTLPHHQLGETFSVGYWTYHCDGIRSAEFLGNGSSLAGRPESAFAVIYLTIRNDDDTASIVPPITLRDSDGHEYQPSPKAMLQKDTLDLTARLEAQTFARGSVIFDVPQARTYFLAVSGGMMSSQMALIDLGKLSTENAPDVAKPVLTSNQAAQDSAPTSGLANSSPQATPATPSPAVDSEWHSFGSSSTIALQDQQASIDLITGQYVGNVYNVSANQAAKFRIVVRDDAGSLSGCMRVDRPLFGSGPIHGRVLGDEITFSVPSGIGVIKFTGHEKRGAVNGTYSVEHNNARADEIGRFDLQKLNSQGPENNFDPANCATDPG